RAAFGLLNANGMLTLSFGITQPWMPLKLYYMVKEATGHTPLIYTSLGQIVLCVSLGELPSPPSAIGNFQRALVSGKQHIDVPTDDWPFLYLSEKTIPADYLIVIGSLLALSLFAVCVLRGRSFRRNDAHFALLG